MEYEKYHLVSKESYCSSFYYSITNWNYRIFVLLTSKFVWKFILWIWFSSILNSKWLSYEKSLPQFRRLSAIWVQTKIQELYFYCIRCLTINLTNIYNRVNYIEKIIYSLWQIFRFLSIIKKISVQWYFWVRFIWV